MKVDNVKNKDIAEYIEKSVDTINGWKQRQPKLLDATRIGVFCKKNNITIEMIKNCIELKEMATKQEEEEDNDIYKR